jgi:hypothetical protein
MMHRPEHDDPGLTVEQAATRLGVSTPTLRRWIRDGALPEGWRAERYPRGGDRTYFTLWGPPEPDASTIPDDASAAIKPTLADDLPPVPKSQPDFQQLGGGDPVHEQALALARDLTQTYRELLDESTAQLNRTQTLLLAQERTLGELGARAELLDARIAELTADRSTTAVQLAQAREQLDATRQALSRQLVATGEALGARDVAVARAESAEAARAVSESGEHVRSLLLRSQRGWRRLLLRLVLGAEALSILQVLR